MEVESLDDHEGVMAMEARRAPVTPGERLLEAFSRPVAASQCLLAKQIGVPSTRVSEIALRRRSITSDTDLRPFSPFGPSRGYWLRAQPAHDEPAYVHVARGTEVAHDRLAGTLGRVSPRATAEEAPCADVGVNLTVHAPLCRMRPARHPPKRSRPILIP